MRLLRFFRNLILHALLIRPACGCGMFTMCLACPRWKLALQARYHEEGAAGFMRPLIPSANRWHHIHHRDGLALRHAGGDRDLLNELAGAVQRYRRQRLWWLVGAGVCAGLALVLGVFALWALATILTVVGYRDEVFGRSVQASRLVYRAWCDAGEGRTCFGVIEQPAKDM